MSTLAVALPGIDSVVEAVVAWLTGPPFRTALDDITKARSDGFLLPSPAIVIPGEVDPTTLNDWPALMVLGGDAPTTSADQQTQSDFNVSVLIITVLQAEDPIVLARQMHRYLLAERLVMQRTTSFFPLLPFAPSALGTMSPEPTRRLTDANRYLKIGTFDFVVPISCDA
jgi:hypothetical protein